MKGKGKSGFESKFKPKFPSQLYNFYAVNWSLGTTTLLVNQCIQRVNEFSE